MNTLHTARYSVRSTYSEKGRYGNVWKQIKFSLMYTVNNNMLRSIRGKKIDSQFFGKIFSSNFLSPIYYHMVVPIVKT